MIEITIDPIEVLFCVLIVIIFIAGAVVIIRVLKK